MADITGLLRYSVKKTTLILFINGRLVECAPLKRALEAVYAGLYAKASKCWVFLDVRMPSAHIDVNVHPTKSEVAFLHQTEFVEGVRDAAERLLMSSHDVRTFARGSATAVKSHVPGAQPCVNCDDILITASVTAFCLVYCRAQRRQSGTVLALPRFLIQ